MWIIGDRLSVKRPEFVQALRERNAESIRELVHQQVETGVGGLLIDLGPEHDNVAPLARWVTQVVQAEAPVPLAIRTPALDAVKVAAETVRGSFMIDATSPAVEDWRAFVPLARERDAYLVLPAAPGALPTDEAARTARVTEELMPAVLAAGIPAERLFIDLFVTSVVCDQRQAPVVVETALLLKRIGEEGLPVPRLLVHLSDISDGAPGPVRNMLNSTFLVMLMAAGLDAVMADPLDERLRRYVRLVENRNETAPLGRLLRRLQTAVQEERSLTASEVDVYDTEQAALFKTARVLRNELIYADGYLEGG